MFLKLFNTIFFTNLFFGIGICIVLLFILSFIFPQLLPLAYLLISLFTLITCIDIVLLYQNKNGIKAYRTMPEKLSNSDFNDIIINCKNFYSFNIDIKIIDEIPFQFQKRDFEINGNIKSYENVNFHYQLKPNKRGEYHFGKINIFCSNFIGLVSRKYSIQQSKFVSVFPSYIQMRQYEFMAFSPHLTQAGFKKIRKIGHSLEFEKIKEYVFGDDTRTLNWKASARKGALMVNQMQDEKSQPVYALIDKGRVMKMPFLGLSLLDYSINSTLAIANIVLKKGDKFGLITYNNKISTIVKAENKNHQLKIINENLYNQKTKWLESDIEKLYTTVRNNINQRSLLLWYSNFETLDAMRKSLPIIHLLNKSHLVVCIIFKNTEFDKFLNEPLNNVRQAYYKGVAEKLNLDKKQIVKELRQHGVETIYTAPENLSIESINLYLSIKASGRL
jgi:uncharacterized protein (DUF58 family)